MIYKNLLPVSVENSELAQSGLLQCHVCCICSKCGYYHNEPHSNTVHVYSCFSTGKN
jgi:hypothetical protein